MHGLPQRTMKCPICGTQSNLLMDFYEQYAQLDAFGMPQYYCSHCNRLVTARDVPQQNTQQVRKISPSHDLQNPEE